MKYYWAIALALLTSTMNLVAEEAQYQFVGSHFLASYYDCDPDVLNDQEVLIAALTEAIEHSGATLLKMADYKFEPMGVTLVALLSESHASIHTYPEFKACFVDFFTCGDRCDYTKFDAVFRKALKAASSNSQHIARN